MNSTSKSEELYKISFDAIEEDSTDVWHSLLQNLSNANLENLRAIFQRNSNNKDEEMGLNRNEFLEVICSFYEGPQYSLQSLMLFDEINQHGKPTILWDEFLDFLVRNMYPKIDSKLSLNVCSIEKVAHTNNEAVAKIVLIETDKYFCYAIILKHGRVGLYDGNLNFLTSYHAIMTREDLTRPEDERRRRNRWVTDAIFCQDVQMFIIVNTARSIMIYEASGLKHVPYWLILSTPNIIQCLTYKPYTRRENSSTSKSIIFYGDNCGDVASLIFHQPKNGLLRRKRNDNLTLFYWDDFLKEKEYVLVKIYKQVHNDSVKHIQYFEEDDLLVTCCKDNNSSVIVKHISNKRKSVCYKIPRGAICFALSILHRIMITGTDDGVITLWNFLISKPIAVLQEYQTDVLDIKILERQELFFSCSKDGIFKLWDLKEFTCLQTIKLKFPSFRIHGKLIDWGINCIYPGPKRRNPDESKLNGANKKECFGINDIDEMKLEYNGILKRNTANVWERSNILITCCNYLSKLRMNFNNATIEYSFTFPILPPPPLQNSVLIPLNWGLQSGELEFKSLERPLKNKVEKQIQDLSFILDKNILEEREQTSDINYKIAILESKKELMRAKVALGAPYLGLDLYDVEELKLAEHIPAPNRKKTLKYVQRIENLLKEASTKDEMFSAASSTSRSKSTRSSIIEFSF